MSAPRFFAFTALVFMGFSAPAHAQTSGYYSSNNAYQFGGQPGGFGYNNAGSTQVFDLGFRNTGGLNLLGCGGIGAFNFMNTTFNMSNIIDQLKQNMQTMLAKQLLIQAMSIPQVSAIFDTLNAFGNAKFSLFNQSCNLSSIKKEARDKVIAACIASHGGSGASAADKTACQQDFDKDANIGKFVQTAFKNICGFENFNQAIRPTACRDDSGNPTASCSFMAFIPQYRLNLSGGVGGNNAGAMCQTSSGYYGTHSSALPLQTVSDVVRSIGDIYANKAQTQVESFRAGGGTYAELKNASDKVDALCAAKDPKCTNAATKTADLTNPASPGFVRLATINLKQLGFADNTAGSNNDAALDFFKKTHNINDNDPAMDPLLKAKVLAQVLSEDNPGINLASLDLTDKDATDFTKNLQFSVAGDANAASQLGIDAKAATAMLQIATTWVMAKQLKVPTDMFIEVEYKKGHSCAEALRNGYIGDVSHAATLEVLSTEAEFGKSLQTAVNSKQIKPTNASGGPVTDASADTLMDDATQKAYNTAVNDGIHRLEDAVARETRAYQTQQGNAKKLATKVCLPDSDNATQDDGLDI